MILYDDGTHGDINSGDGYYSTPCVLENKGTYQVIFSASGIVDSTPFERTDTMTLWVTELGDIDSDEDVDFSDYSLFAGKWTKNGCINPSWCDRTDFNKNGTVDIFDLLILAQNWLVGKNIVDIDMNRKVNLGDYTIFASHWTEQNCAESSWCYGTDFNKDGIVDIADLVIFSEHWLEGIDTCPDDPEKTQPGVCGCGIPDIDVNGDGLMDCGFRYGDVSGEGEVTALDAALASQCANGLVALTDLQQYAADVDGDSCVSSIDANLIAQYAVGLISSFSIEQINLKPTVVPECNCQNN